ncbi:MAG: delta-60 repeat domain-containing protein, partial [Verrucomicrobiales bacterium]|nr:delta-60 repeat domain-containing protein [Verrucomicrobiales bacterium]
MRSTFAFLLAITGWSCFAGPDVLDPSFRGGVAPNLRGPDGPVHAMAEGTDSTVILAGDFARVNGVPRNAIARLLPDGSLDPAFAPNAAPDGAIRSVTVTPNGSVLVAGDFSHWGAVAAGDHCVRLKPDGSLDESFTASPPFTGSVTQILSLADQSLLVLGKKSDGGVTRDFLQHRGSDGTVDPGFQPVLSADAALNALAREAAGTLLVAGRFQEFDGHPATNLVRLRADLTLEEGFQSVAAAAAGELYGVAAATDGRIAIGGVVTNPFPNSVLGVLTSQGGTDPVFVRSGEPFQPISAVAFDTAGNLLAVEDFLGRFFFLHRFSPTGAHSEPVYEGTPAGAAPLARSNGHVLWALDGSTRIQDAIWSWLLETFPDGTANPQFNPGPGLPGELPWPI